MIILEDTHDGRRVELYETDFITIRLHAACDCHRTTMIPVSAIKKDLTFDIRLRYNKQDKRIFKFAGKFVYDDKTHENIPVFREYMNESGEILSWDESDKLKNNIRVFK